MTDNHYSARVPSMRDAASLEGTLKDVTVAELMGPVLVQAHPRSGMEAVAEPLLEWEGVSHFPVVDDLQRPVGVLERTDILEWQLSLEAARPSVPEAGLFGISPSSRVPDGKTVGDVMQRSAIAVTSHSGIDLVAAILAHEGTPMAMVIDGEGRVTGLIWARQILAWLADRMGYVVPRRGHPSGSR